MWAFSNYSVVQRIILFQSGTPHKMLMVTSLWHVRVPVLHPCGLVLNFWRLWCQFRGGWSQPMANLTSEFDSNTFAGEETQHHFLYFFFSSLTTDVNRVSQNPRVPASHGEHRSTPGVRIHFIICFWFLSIFLSSPGTGNGYSEGRWPNAYVGVLSCITTKASSTNSVFCGSVVLWLCKNYIFFFHVMMILWSDDTSYFIFHCAVACYFYLPMFQNKWNRRLDSPAC